MIHSKSSRRAVQWLVVHILTIHLHFHSEIFVLATNDHSGALSNDSSPNHGFTVVVPRKGDDPSGKLPASNQKTNRQEGNEDATTMTTDAPGEVTFSHLTPEWSRQRMPNPRAMKKHNLVSSSTPNLLQSLPFKRRKRGSFIDENRVDDSFFSKSQVSESSTRQPVDLLRRAKTSISSVAIIFLATAKLVVPLKLVEQIFQLLYTVGQDWYTGWYIRTTFERIEQQYHRQYQVPAVFRSLGRLAVHLAFLFTLGEFAEWLVGLRYSPCQSNAGGCQFWCALLWLASVSSVGHAAGVVLAIWGWILRVQVDESDKPRPSLKRIFLRPWNLARWILDPDKWFRDLLAKDRRDPAHALKPFDPNWLMFPATWGSLKMLQWIGVAKEMYGDKFMMNIFMRQFLVSQALGDEWYRVLFCERRIALGICVLAAYTVSTLGIFFTALRKPAPYFSSISILFMTPSVLAVFISAWMNLLVYFDRAEKIPPEIQGVNDQVQEALHHYKRVTQPLRLRA
jgi:hypothetical protein